MNSWILEATQLNKDNHLHDAPVNTIGNGLACCRGFFEEQQDGIAALGGIYMTGVFGHASYTPWFGESNELVNVPNFFYIHLKVNGKTYQPLNSDIRDFKTSLNLETSTLTRECVYFENDKPLLKCCFTRFISCHCIYNAGQKIDITPLQDNLCVEIECSINANITNLNDVSCEPHPIQPGKKQYSTISQNADYISVEIPKPERIELSFAQSTIAKNAERLNHESAHHYKIELPANTTATIEKLVAFALSPIDGDITVALALSRLNALHDYGEEYQLHCLAMKNQWDNMDIKIDGCNDDQLTLRYNILQLMQSCPRHTSMNSIGARGLTGEMYEGSVFWDTEIFMVPFFTLTNPDAAKKLLEFRYNTLPEARRHAVANWFKGAMYGWQVNSKGIEQTPQGVGAYYSIHVIADIAFAILEYWYASGDVDFILNCGLEILIETARFWESRSTKRADGLYDIMAVRGPNEYDVLVNNNLYTNMMARENFILCEKLITDFESEHAQQLTALYAKLNFDKQEIEKWHEISDKYVLPYDDTQKLWLEDDTYLRRMTLDMARAKPTAKRIIDTTIPYEALPFYQVSKQADVLHLMKNLPWHFSEKEIVTAYDYYRSRTAFDSSLSYSMFALMSARLGKTDDAVKYYDLTANLDIKNVQLNTISGLHFANFGGTWQTVMFGFAGVAITENGITIRPQLPQKWSKLSFRLHYKGAVLNVTASNASVDVVLEKEGVSQVNLIIFNKEYKIATQNEQIIALA